MIYEYQDEVDFLRGLATITFMVIFSPIIVLISIPLGLVNIYKFIRGAH